MATASRTRPSLTLLDLSGNQLGTASGQRLAKVLSAGGDKGAAPLARLDLSTNSLGAEGASALAGALVHNKTLTSLSLLDNGLEAEGAAKCSIALKNNRTLTSLWLGKNKLGNEGVGAVVDAMIRREDAVKFDCCAATCTMASRCCSHFASSSEAQSVAAIVKFCKIEQ